MSRQIRIRAFHPKPWLILMMLTLISFNLIFSVTVDVFHTRVLILVNVQLRLLHDEEKCTFSAQLREREKKNHFSVLVSDSDPITLQRSFSKALGIVSLWFIWSIQFSAWMLPISPFFISFYQFAPKASFGSSVVDSSCSRCPVSIPPMFSISS